MIGLPHQVCSVVSGLIIRARYNKDNWTDCMVNPIYVLCTENLSLFLEIQPLFLQVKPRIERATICSLYFWKVNPHFKWFEQVEIQALVIFRLLISNDKWRPAWRVKTFRPKCIVHRLTSTCKTTSSISSADSAHPTSEWDQSRLSHSWPKDDTSHWPPPISSSSHSPPRQ